LSTCSDDNALVVGTIRHRFLLVSHHIPFDAC
jgi:hypothetical protein